MKPPRAPRFGLLLIALFLLRPALAAAEAEAPPPEDEEVEAQGSAENATAVADSLIERGLTLREQNQDEEAIALFERAYDLARSPRALAQLALAEQALGRWVRAETHLLAALATHDPWVQERTEVLEGALGTIREHLSNLEVRGGNEGAEIRVDGRVRGQLPLGGPLRVPAATVRIEVRQPGYLPFELDLPARAGATEVVDVELAEDPNYVPPDQRIVQVVAPADREANPLVWVGTGLTALGFAGGAVFGVLASGLHNDWEMRCASPLGCAASLRSEGQSMALLADISFGVAAAGGVVALLALLLDPPWAEPEAGSGASLLRLRLAGGPGQIGAGLRLEF